MPDPTNLANVVRASQACFTAGMSAADETGRSAVKLRRLLAQVHVAIIDLEQGCPQTALAILREAVE